MASSPHPHPHSPVPARSLIRVIGQNGVAVTPHGGRLRLSRHKHQSSIANFPPGQLVPWRTLLNVLRDLDLLDLLEQLGVSRSAAVAVARELDVNVF